MTISTHVLDTSIGRPAADVTVFLYRYDGSDWTRVGHGCTDSDGRVASLLAVGAEPAPGAYRLVFEVMHYFFRRNVDSFYSQITIEFVIREGNAHYHVPLLVSPYGYSTYRGS